MSPEVVGCFLCQELISILLVSVRYLSKENFKWVFSGLHIRLFSVLPHWFVPEIGYNSYSANFNLFKDLKVEVCGFSLIVVLSLCFGTFFFNKNTCVWGFAVFRYARMPPQGLKDKRHLKQNKFYTNTKMEMWIYVCEQNRLIKVKKKVHKFINTWSTIEMTSNCSSGTSSFKDVGVWGIK